MERGKDKQQQEEEDEQERGPEEVVAECSCTFIKATQPKKILHSTL